MLRAVQEILLAALLDSDPPAALRRSLGQQPDLTNEERVWLEQLDADGLVMSSLLVKKLRFERLTRGESRMAQLFEDDPQKFMRIYNEYDAAVPPTAYFPQDEAEQFRRWEQERGG